MPEGDTVYLASQRLRRALAGKVLTTTDFRVPAIATIDLTGRVLDDVVPRGKHLLFRIEGGWTLHTHFKMEGAWHLYRPGRPWRGPQHEVRAVLANEERVAVGFRLAITELIPTTEEHTAVGHLGPDPLGPDWNEDLAVANLVREPDREISDALLDQRNIAGPGNVYRCEALFLTGVHPRTLVRDVPNVRRIVSLTARMMDANRTTGSQVTTGDMRPGRERWVYGRMRRPCRRCGTPIAREVPPVGGRERVTYWCPRCQPEQRAPKEDARGGHVSSR